MLARATDTENGPRRAVRFPVFPTAPENVVATMTRQLIAIRDISPQLPRGTVFDQADDHNANILIAMRVARDYAPPSPQTAPIHAPSVADDQSQLSARDAMPERTHRTAPARSRRRAPRSRATVTQE